jgi:hypothetical protein
LDYFEFSRCKKITQLAWNSNTRWDQINLWPKFVNSLNVIGAKDKMEQLDLSGLKGTPEVIISLIKKLPVMSQVVFLKLNHTSLMDTSQTGSEIVSAIYEKFPQLGELHVQFCHLNQAFIDQLHLNEERRCAGNRKHLSVFYFGNDMDASTIATDHLEIYKEPHYQRQQRERFAHIKAIVPDDSPPPLPSCSMLSIQAPVQVNQVSSGNTLGVSIANVPLPATLPQLKTLSTSRADAQRGVRGIQSTRVIGNEPNTSLAQAIEQLKKLPNACSSSSVKPPAFATTSASRSPTAHWTTNKQCQRCPY